jgi:hypothetical protein
VRRGSGFGRRGIRAVQRDRRIQHLDYKLAALRNIKIRHIASVVAVRRHQPVLLAAWVEVAAGGIERRFAFSHRVHMKGMLACRQPLRGPSRCHTAAWRPRPVFRWIRLKS